MTDKIKLPEWISKTGGYQSLDKEGYLLCPEESKLVSPWKEAAHTMASFTQDRLGPEVVSAYVVGSSAMGSAVPKLSDVDVYVLTKTVPDLLDRSWVETATATVSGLFPEVTAVDLTLLPYEDIVNGCTLYVERFQVQCQSILLFGVDARTSIPPYKIDKELGVGLYGTLGKQLETFKTLTTQGLVSLEEVKSFARRVLRTAFALVMEKQQKFTRDPYWCYEAFVLDYPDKQAWAQVVLEMCFRPTTEQERLRVLVEDLAPWVVAEFAKIYSINDEAVGTKL